MDTRTRMRYIYYHIYHNGEKIPMEECEIEFQIIEEFDDGDMTSNMKKKTAREFFLQVESLGHKYMTLLHEKEQDGK